MDYKKTILYGLMKRHSYSTNSLICLDFSRYNMNSELRHVQTPMQHTMVKLGLGMSFVGVDSGRVVCRKS